jgi:hypothetical protein
MTKFLFAVLVLSLCFLTSHSFSQCLPRSNFYWGEMLPNNGCATFASYSPFGPGEYFRMPVLQGASYRISTCGNSIDTQITGFQGNTSASSIFYNDDNGPDCAGTQASVVFTPNFTDYTRVEVSEYNCLPGGSQSITVKVRQNNNLLITSSAANMCQGETRTLTATPARVNVTPLAGSGDVGTFSGTGVTGTTFTAPVPTGSSANYTITYTFGYCSTTQNITVFKNPTTSNAGADQTVCSASTNLAGNAPAVGTGAWSVVSGPGSVTSPNSPTSGVTGLSSITPTTFRWTISNGPCTASVDDVTITVDAPPSVSDAGPDQSICVDIATLAGNTPSVGTGMWSLVGGSGSITTPSDPASGVSSLAVGNNTFRWTISNGVCTPSTDDVVITRNSLPVVAFTAPADLCIDAGVQAGLGGGAPAKGTVPQDTSYYAGPGVTDDGNGMTYSFDPLDAGAGIHTITYTYIDDTGCSNSAMDDVEVFALPVVTFSGDLSFCLDAGVQTGLGGATPTGGVYSGPGVTNDGNGMTYSFDPVTSGVGDHTVSYLYSDGTCDDEVTITISVVSAGANTWIGPATGNWNDSGTNWSRGFIPKACDDVLIPAGNNVTLLSSNSGICNTIEVQNGANFHVESGGVLTVMDP